jgi:prepilin-type N-terminal cleavage/methylation domain-containing protein
MYATKLSNFVTSARRARLERKASSLTQRGYSMIEIAIGTVIVGLLLAVTISYVRGIIADNRANDELKELPLVMSRLTKLYSNRPDFAGLDTATAISNNIYPPERITSATVLNNRFGGTIAVAPATGTVANDSASLTYTGVGASECKSMIPQLEKSMSQIKVGATTVKAIGANVDFSALGTSCVDNVTVIYQFKKS